MTLTTRKTGTQKDAIRAALEAGRKLTDLEALRDFGCRRLGARIYDLKAEGLGITSRLVKTPDGAHVAEYSLTPPADSTPP